MEDSILKWKKVRENKKNKIKKGGTKELAKNETDNARSFLTARRKKE